MKYGSQHVTAPDGTEMVVLKAADFARLRALAEEGEDVAEALAIEARIGGGEETVPGDVVKRIVVDRLTPLAAWRSCRGLSQTELARRTGLRKKWGLSLFFQPGVKEMGTVPVFPPEGH